MRPTGGYATFKMIANPMKYVIALALLILSPYLFAEEKIVSQAKDRDAKVIGVVDSDGAANSIKLVVNGKTVWTCSLSWGYPASTEVLWSPYSTKVAIGIRTTKTTSEVHIFDCWQELKELPIPDIAQITRQLNSNIVGRFMHVSPAGWDDENTVILLSRGNLIDSTTDGSDTLNFLYQATIHIPTQRVIAINCLSSHNLNDEILQQRKSSAR